jgi:predicted kinase
LVCGPAGVGKSSFVELFIKKFNFIEANKVIETQEDSSDEQAPSEEIKNYNKYIIKKATERFEEKTIS